MSPEPSFDLIVVGDLLIDVVAVGDQAHRATGAVHGRVGLHPGGSAANAAVWAATASARVGVVGVVGDDVAGRTLRLALAERGVDVSRVYAVGAATGAMVSHVRAAGSTIVASRGANALLRVEHLPEAMDAGAVLVSGYTLADPATEPAARAALARARAANVAVHAPPPETVSRRGAEWFFAATRGASIVFANENEAHAVTGERGEAAARALASRYRLSVVTLGARGAVIGSAEGVAHARSPGVSEIDPTGAGDAFAGVFLATIARGASISDAARRACEAGARCAGQEPRWPALKP